MPLESQSSFHSDGDQFYMMVGQSIAEWASVDDELFNIFQDAVGPREQCAIIYFRIQSLSTRFELTDEIVRSVLPKPEKPKKSGGHDHADVKAWDAARGNYQELLGVRSRIAHHPVEIGLEEGRAGLFGGPFGTQIFNSPGLPPPQTWFEIAASRNERLRERPGNSRSLKIDDLREHIGKVTALRGRLNDFFHNVLTKKP